MRRRSYRALSILLLGYPLLLQGVAKADPISISLFGVIAGPPEQFQIMFEDATEGLSSIQVETLDNASAAIPAFTDTTSPVVVTVTKIDQSLGFDGSFTAMDGAGEKTTANFSDAGLTVKASVPEPTSALLLGSLISIAAAKRVLRGRGTQV